MLTKCPSCFANRDKHSHMMANVVGHEPTYAPECHFEPCASLLNGMREQLTYLRFECHKIFAF
jgi:hypothetical protein